MKYLIILLSLFTVQLASAQFDVRNSVDAVCDCISEGYDEVKNAEEATNKLYDECAKSRMQWPSEEEFEKMTASLSDEEVTEFYTEFATRAFSELSNYLIGGCPVWNMHYYEKRQKMIAKRKDEPNEDMIALFSKELEKEESLEMRMNRCFCYISTGQIDEALEDFEMCLKLGPEEARTYYLGGEIAEASGDYEVAMELYAKAYEISKDEQYFILIAVTNTKIKLSTK